jgi:transketolase
MSDQVEQPAEQTPERIPAAAQLWDELLQGREEQRQFRQDFEDHRVRTRERHDHLQRQLTDVLAMAESNTAAREYFEDEIKQLHTVMRQWYHTIIDLQKMIVLLTEQLETEQLIVLKPPLPLRSREHAA